ncbi:MAG: hypothetical protein MJE68_29170 [Proteobacteria bacterium]|nr:hypothetical protein [Pseudomonadota bacterium]
MKYIENNEYHEYIEYTEVSNLLNAMNQRILRDTEFHEMEVFHTKKRENFTNFSVFDQNIGFQNEAHSKNGVQGAARGCVSSHIFSKYMNL